MRRGAPFLALALGCVSGVGFQNESHPGPTRLGIGPDAPGWIWDADVESRALATAHASANVWGLRLDGVVIHLVNDLPSPCSNLLHLACTTVTGSDLTLNREIHIWITPLSRPGVPAACVEATLLSHEVGHVRTGDMDVSHSQFPGWHDREFWDRMADTLSALHPECGEAIETALSLEGV